MTELTPQVTIRDATPKDDGDVARLIHGFPSPETSGIAGGSERAVELGLTLFRAGVGRSAHDETYLAILPPQPRSRGPSSSNSRYLPISWPSFTACSRLASLRSTARSYEQAERLALVAKAADARLAAFSTYKLTEACVSRHAQYAQHRFPGLPAPSPRSAGAFKAP